MSEDVPQSNSFAALDEENGAVPIDTADIQVTNEKPKTERKHKERRNAQVFGTGDFKTAAEPHEVKLASMLNNTDHYLELAQVAINCLCKRAVDTIQRRLNQLVSGTTSMNVLGPVFKDEFFVRLDEKKWALVKESVLKVGKVEIDGTDHVLNPQNAIRVWDLICGPNDRPTLFRDHKDKDGNPAPILSLGEKLQSIVQEDTRKDLIKEGKLGPTDEYKPAVWLFLAYRRTFRNRQDPCRFISMCWDSDGTTSDRLMPVSEYCTRVDRRPQQNNNESRPRPPRQNGERPAQQKNNESRPRPARQNTERRFENRQLNQPTQHGRLDRS